MLKLNIIELLRKKEKTKYWLSNQLDMSYTNVITEKYRKFL